MKPPHAALLLSLLAWPGSAAADVFPVNMSTLPNPAGCANYQAISGGAADAACDAAIAGERDPKAKSVMLFRRAFIEDAPADFSKYPAALADLDLAIKLFPQNWAALHERGYIYVEYGRWRDALNDLNAQIAINPRDPDGYRERALARFKLGDLQGAFDDREADIRAGTTMPGAYLARARAAMWLGKFDAAAAEIAAVSRTADQAHDDKSTASAAGLQRELARWTANSGARAIKDCAASDSMPEPADANLIGDCTVAFLAATTPKDRADALTRRGTGWLIARDQGASVGDFEIAVALNPTAANLSNLGFGYMQMDHSTAAAEMFDRSIALQPDYVPFAGRAAARSNLGDLDGAEADARKSIALHPNDVAYTVLGDVAYARTKTYDKAKDFWIAAYKLGDRDDGLIDRLKKAGVAIPPPDAGTSP